MENDTLGLSTLTLEFRWGKDFPQAPTAWGSPLSAGAPATPRLRTGRRSLTDSPGRTKPSCRSKLSSLLPLPEAVIPYSFVALPPPLRVCDPLRLHSTPSHETTASLLPLPVAPAWNPLAGPPDSRQSFPDRPPLPGAVPGMESSAKAWRPASTPPTPGPLLSSHRAATGRSVIRFSDRLRRGTPARVKAAHRA